MVENPGVIKLILELYHSGYPVVAIAKVLNLPIIEVADVINAYK
jgi:hypothetical protein